ncbi:hypothetical protein [Tenacibaculum sp. nBUS_03]|uniref:hypothetical protein n=1 Tax=Tenacibaculum sp. nBUS_03 TaxID=3395320 RepID=UPI003EBF2A37
MWDLFNNKKVIIESDRDSVCMGDDMSRHNKFSEFPNKMKMGKLILELSKIHFISKGWAIWAGTYDNYKCIKDGDGNWLIDKNITLKTFFRDTEKYVFFDKESFEKKCKKKNTANKI